jgi:hypothetical protein
MARRKATELAWIGCALSICTLSKQRGRLRLDKNTSDLGLIEALEKHIGGRTSGGGHHGEGYAPQSGESRERWKWFFGDEAEIEALLQASWPWLTKTAQAKARELRVAKPRRRRSAARGW